MNNLVLEAFENRVCQQAQRKGDLTHIVANATEWISLFQELRSLNCDVHYLREELRAASIKLA